MVYRFRIISGESREFAREMLISDEQSFLDFHKCLQKDLGYDPDQLSSFFITNASWEKELQITLIDMMDEGDASCTTMDQSILGNHLSETGQRMLYVFDFFSERSFFIELIELIDAKESKALPKIVFSSGNPPQQIELALGDLTLTDEDLNEDLNEDFPSDSLGDLGDEFDFTDSDDFTDE